MVFKAELDASQKTLPELLDLIEKKKLNIEDVLIAGITGQYLEYLKKEKPETEDITQFLTAATRLLNLKVKSLTPSVVEEAHQEDEGMDIAQELAQHLMEYRTFKEAAGLFKQRLDEEPQVFVRQVDFDQYVNSVSTSSMLEGVGLGDLINALEKVLQREGALADNSYEIPRQDFKVADKMEEITRMVFNTGDKGIEFEHLFTHHTVKGEIIAIFLALLELVRLRKVRISQKEAFGKIVVYQNL